MYRIYKFSKDKSFGVYLKHLSIFFLGGFHSMRFTKGLNEYWRTLFVSPFGTDFRPTFVGAFLAWSWRIFFSRYSLVDFCEAAGIWHHCRLLLLLRGQLEKTFKRREVRTTFTFSSFHWAIFVSWYSLVEFWEAIGIWHHGRWLNCYRQVIGSRLSSWQRSRRPLREDDIYSWLYFRFRMKAMARSISFLSSPIEE